MHKALVRSHVCYCDIIYHVPSKQDLCVGILNFLMEKAERIQCQVAFAITGAWRSSNLSDELCWESLSDRRWCRRVLQIKRPRFLRPIYSQNNINTFHGIRCKSYRYMNMSWNYIFKTHFTSYSSREKSIIGINDPSELRNLVQLNEVFFKILQKT